MEGIDASGGAAEDGFDAREEDGFGKGLGDVIIGAYFKAFDDVLFGGLGGEHDDGRRGGGGRFADASANRQAVYAREHQIKKDKRGLFAEDHFEA